MGRREIEFDDDFDEAPQYWEQARQPLICLIFLAPLLVVYELGVYLLGGNQADSLRSGADYWMRSWLQELGLGQHLVLPGLIVSWLFIWHLWNQDPWKVSLDTLIGMFAESLLFAFFLIVCGQVQDFLVRHWNTPTALALGGPSTTAALLSYVGAGIYEETLFRLCLLPPTYGILRGTRMPVMWATVLSIIVTSLAFATAHYVGPNADQFALFSFSFRLLAGVFFGALFWLRGFGIVVGCHAAYDLIVGILIALEA